MRLSKNGRAVYAKVEFWWDKDGSIHLIIEGKPKKGHLAVYSDPAKPNGHRTLHARLAKELRENGAAAPANWDG